jgi:ribonuclease BN (tRNA processing enzyme)
MLLDGGPARVAVDFGASSLIGLKRLGYDPSTIETVVLTHLHGDHFGGLPFLILDGQFSRRTAPLTVVGPVGVRGRTLALMEAMFPGSSTIERRFAVSFEELTPVTEILMEGLAVSGIEVNHPSGAPAHAVRVIYGERTVVYSGDGERSEALVEFASGAGLVVCEGYSFDKRIPFHASFSDIAGSFASLNPGRVVVTHMNAEMLARVPELERSTQIRFAYDGLTIHL